VALNTTTPNSIKEVVALTVYIL